MGVDFILGKHGYDLEIHHSAWLHCLLVGAVSAETPESYGILAPAVTPLAPRRSHGQSDLSLTLQYYKAPIRACSLVSQGTPCQCKAVNVVAL